LSSKESEMKKPFKILMFLTLVSLFSGPLVFAADETPTPGEDSLAVEKLKLQIEELKLENQRLQLQIQSLQLESPANHSTPTVVPTPTPVDKKKEGEKVAKDMEEKAKVLAQQYATDEHQFILDFSNGVMYYKGIHYRMSDFKDLCDDLHWGVKPAFVKFDIGGDSMNRYRYRNVYLDRYSSQTRGVLVFEAPKNANDFIFVTPETANSASSFVDYRNLFETAYYTFDKERKEDGYRVLRFHHPEGFLGFDDVLEFWFDNKDNFVRLKWGMLDKK